MSFAKDDIQRAASAIIEADGLIIGAGAGMGVDSGLPDFRGQQGFWRAYPALAEAGYKFTEIANPQAFASNPQMAWGFYGHRFNLYRATKPHDGFKLLKSIGERLPFGYQIFTSNVDGHFQVAGFESTRVYECHGSIKHLQCRQACSNDIWSAEHLDIVTNDTRCIATSELPTCPHCQDIARPNILMFGDYYWISSRSDKQAQRMNNNVSLMQKPVVIELGAGTAVPTVRYFCERSNGKLIRINPRDYQCNRNNAISLAVGAKRGVELIFDALKSRGFF